MDRFELLMNEYAESHQNEVNIKIHKFCVPLIVWSIMGILWSLPSPSFMADYEINWALLILVPVLIYYYLLNVRYFLFMFSSFITLSLATHLLFLTGYLLGISISVFILSWVFQFIGHKIEGKKPSFFKDLQFLLIGPLWVIREIFED